MLRAVRLVSFIGLAAFIASTACSLGKNAGASCTSNDECASSCCLAGTVCSDSESSCSQGSTSGGTHSSSSSSSSGSSSPSNNATNSSSSGGSDSGAATGPAYVEFFEDFSKFGVAPGIVVQYIEAEGSNYTPEPLAKGTGTCADKNVFQGAPATSPLDLAVAYTIYARNYDSLDATMSGQPYTNVEYKGGFHLSELKPGCNTLVVYDTMTHGLGLQVQH